MRESWAGKTALITGGAGGIGAAVAQQFADAGGRVVIADSDEDAARQTAQRIGEERAIFVRTDVTSETDTRRAVEAAMTAFGRLDFLHNNASVMHRHERIEDIPLASFMTVIEVNLVGMFLAAKAAVPAMKAGGGGVIVNMSSRGGSRGQSHILAYSATKAGILAFTRGLAEQLRPAGIRVNALIPGLVNTPMALGGPNMRNAAATKSYVFNVEEMARAVLFTAGQDNPRGVVLEYSGTTEGPKLYEVGELERREIPDTIGVEA